MTAYAAIGGAVIVLLFLIWLALRYARTAGAAGAQRDAFRMKSEQARQANEIDECVADLSDDQLDRELRER